MENICLKLDRIEKLIEAKNFKQALAEIRDIETAHALEEGLVEFGHFCYLSAVALRQLGDYKTALSKAQKAFAIYKATGENKRIAKIQYTLGNIYLALGDLGNAKDEFRDSLATYKRIDDEEGILSVLNILARIYFNQSEFETAIRYLSDCIQRCDQIGEKTMKARLFGNLGRIYLLIGKWKEAKENLQISLELNKLDNNLINICCSYLSLGYVSYLLRDFSQSNKYLEDAIKLIFENSYTREFAIYHEYAGELDFAQGNYEGAKNHYLDAIEIGEKIAPDSGIISQTYRLLAEVQIAEKQYDEAFSSCEKALKVATSLGEKIEIGAIHRALGQIYTAKREKQKAKENFEKSISISDQIGAKFELGKAYLESGKSDSFEFIDRVQYLGRAKEIFKELNSGYHEGLVQLAISKLFFDNQEPEKAILFLNEAEKIFKESKEEQVLSSLLSFRKILEKTLGKSESIIDDKGIYKFSNIVTRDQKMLDLLEKLKRVKNSDLTILLEGETGTGKDLLAKTIHYESERKNKKFVVAQCSAIPDTLLENALFGHAKGSYTGANESSGGLFEEAAGGTLYLDEIAEIPLFTQVKLLRSIEEKEITRIGETKPRKVEVRIISSTSRNLNERVSSGLFRQDLYFRLNALSFKIPPLRERKEDVLLLTEHFLKENGWGKDATKILYDPELIERIREYNWPGNVRELKHEIEKLVTLAVTTEGIDLNLLKERCNQFSDDSRKPSLYEEVFEFEKKRIIKALEGNDWVITKAAEALKIHEASLRTKLKKYRIEKLSKP